MTIPNDETKQRVVVGLDPGGVTRELQVDTDGRIVLSEKVELDGIGGVELKDAVNANRARVSDPGDGLDALHVQDTTLHAAVVPIPVANSIQGGGPVPVLATTLTTLAGLGAGQALRQGAVIQAMVGNVGPIAVGPTNAVDPTAGAQDGSILQPNQSVPMPYDNTDNIFVRSTNAVDRVTFWGG